MPTLQPYNCIDWIDGWNMPKKKILMPLPSYGFDPTEASISWEIIQAAGHQVVFATVDGNRAYADKLMISGEGLDPWGFIPIIRKLKAIGLLLRASKDAREAYQQMQQTSAFLQPLTFDEISAQDFDGLLLPGGHDKGMRPYLENQTLQQLVAEFFELSEDDNRHKPVAAVCHGVVLAARSISKKTGRSVLYGRKTTALTWSQEKAAWNLTRYFARFWDPLYYRTYAEAPDEPNGYRSVEHEVTRALEQPEDFVSVATTSSDYKLKTQNIARDSGNDSRPAWVVRDGNYLSARWPGDVHTFAQSFVKLLDDKEKINPISSA